MPKILRALAGAIAGYGAGVIAGFALVTLLSSNTHDKSVESAMTAFFFAGPIGAVIGAFLAARRRR